MRRIIAIAVLVGALCCFNLNAYACSCAWAGPFLKVARNAKHIVLGRVVEHTNRSGSIFRAMEFDVIETLSGKLDKSHIKVWGDSGMLCRPYIALFPIGTTWILALDSPNKGMGDEDGYSISGCGTYWLEVVGDTVRGKISKSALTDKDPVEEISLQEIRSRVKAHNPHEDGTRQPAS
jgi:hypothetical protein